MYIATEDQGLWYSANRRAVSPIFTQVGGYPFRFPSRVFFNPYDANEIWVTSFGNGMRLGRVIEPRPVLSGPQMAGPSLTLTVAAAAGQTVVLSASPDLLNWTPFSTNVMYTNRVTVGDATSATTRFFRAEVR